MAPTSSPPDPGGDRQGEPGADQCRRLQQGRRFGRRGVHLRRGRGRDDHKLILGTSNEWQLPLVTRLGYKSEDLTPIATLAVDEFVVWAQANGPYNTITDLVEAGKANPGKVRFGGSQSKDVDQTLVRRIEAATGAKFLYIPFKSGSEAAVQLPATTSTPTPTTRPRTSDSGVRGRRNPSA